VGGQHRSNAIAVAGSWNSRVISRAWMDGQSPDAQPVAWREQVLGLGTDLRSSAVLALSLTTAHLPLWATHQLSVRRIACSGSGTKNVPRPDRTDVVSGRNSTRNSSGTITSARLDDVNRAARNSPSIRLASPRSWTARCINSNVHCSADCPQGAPDCGSTPDCSCSSMESNYWT